MSSFQRVAAVLAVSGAAVLGAGRLEPCGTWQEEGGLPPGLRLFAMARAGEVRVIVGGDALVLRSHGGGPWTQVTVPAVHTLGQVVWTGRRFVAVGYYGTALWSEDGASWTRASTGLRDDEYLWGLAWDGSRLVGVGGSQVQVPGPPLVVTSGDHGNSWMRGALPVAASSLRRVVWGNGRFVAVGMLGTVVTSPDGISWVYQKLGTYDLWDVAWGQGLFVAVGQGAALLTSPDGGTWTRRGSNRPMYLLGVAVGGGRLVAAGEQGLLRTSDDGVTWTDEYRPSGVSFLGVDWIGTEIVVLGEGSTLLRSACPPCTLTASATAMPVLGTPPLAVVFSAAAIPTGCSGPVSYDWDFGDGSPHGAGPTPSHAYPTPGRFHWTLTATADGAVAIVGGEVAAMSPGSHTPRRKLTPGRHP